jgi:cytochrome c oxidase cbb3-type subunit 1
MTATSPTSPTRIDASCRLPLFTLFGGAALWLALSSVFGLIASLTFHKPSMFADSAILSYGRAYPAWSNLLVYGFAIPSGLGVGLWLLARLGRVEVVKPFLIAVGAKLWHLGVLVGLVAILNGQTSGYEWFELPRYAAVILFLAFVLMAIWTFVTYSRRTEETLYPSQWFVLAALFWFPWILSTATLLLQVFPVRGVAQTAVAWWFAGNLLNVWLTLAGLAVTFYLLPKLTERLLQSHYLALFVFWTVLIFGSWTGIPLHSPLPAWMSTLSSVATVMMIVPILGVVMIVVHTTKGAKVACGGGPLCYAKFGAFMLAFASIAAAIAACPALAHVTDFTWFTHGHTTLRLYGFFAMTMFAAVYYILPRISGVTICPRRVKAHFWFAMPGALLLALPLIGGGIAQGLKLANPDVPFLEAAKAALMPFRMSTLGELMILIGALIFLGNISLLIVSYYRAIAKTAYTDATALQPAEVKP